MLFLLVLLFFFLLRRLLGYRDHHAALVADLVLVALETREDHARVIALALAEFRHVRTACGALRGGALRESRVRDQQRNGGGTQAKQHQVFLVCGDRAYTAAKSVTIVTVSSRY